MLLPSISWKFFFFLVRFFLYTNQFCRHSSLTIIKNLLKYFQSNSLVLFHCFSIHKLYTNSTSSLSDIYSVSLSMKFILFLVITTRTLISATLCSIKYKTVMHYKNIVKWWLSICCNRFNIQLKVGEHFSKSIVIITAKIWKLVWI